MTLRDNRFVATDLPPRQNDYDCPSLCFSKADRAVVVMGGHDLRYNLVKSVELHNLQTMVWSDLPDLNLARYIASSCCHGGYIYIFGGYINKSRDMTNSIERLSLSYLRAQTFCLGPCNRKWLQEALTPCIHQSRLAWPPVRLGRDTSKASCHAWRL